jgi:hypothetical protein
MIKSLLALAVFGLLGTAVVVFSPQGKAAESAALAKGNRLEIRSVARTCSQQVWPNFEISCLHKAHSTVMIREVRLVTARR